MKESKYTILSPNGVAIDGLTTESRNASTGEIDRVSTLELAALLNAEDKKVPDAVEKVLPAIAAAIDTIAARLQEGGRLFYVGAGTSGRLGVLDAAECPPTFGIDPELVQGIIAGGPEAVFRSQEGAEDTPVLALNDLKAKKLSIKDVVVGIAASGRTPYVIGALEFAHRIGAATIALTCNENARITEIAEISIVPVVGPEAITGSTRLKAGTAQKLVLNMLSTGVMIRLGKVYGNLMVDVQTTNLKLVERACRIVMEATGASRAESEACLKEANGNVKTAVFALLSGLPPTQAQRLLAENQGYIARALAQCKNSQE